MLVTVGFLQLSGHSINRKWDLSSGTNLNWGELCMRSSCRQSFLLWDIQGERLSDSPSWCNKIPNKSDVRKRGSLWRSVQDPYSCRGHSSSSWRQLASSHPQSGRLLISLLSAFNSVLNPKEWCPPHLEWSTCLGQCDLETSSLTCAEVCLHPNPWPCQLDNRFKTSQSLGLPCH